MRRVIYIVDYTYAEVRKFSPNGELLLAFSTGGYSSSGAFGIVHPVSLTVDAAGSIYVVGEQSEDGLRKFDAQGQPQWDFTVPGNTLSTRIVVKDVTLDRSGRVFVLTSNSTVCQLSAEGQLERQVPVRVPDYTDRTDTDALLALDAAGNLYTTISQGNAVRKFDPAGTFLGFVGNNLSSSTRTALAFDGTDNLYATVRDHSGSSRLLKYNPAGQEVGRWGNLDKLDCITQDEAGNYYYVDRAKHQVMKYTAAGQLVLQISDHVQREVSSLAVDALGNIYTLAGNGGEQSQINKFSPEGRYLTQYQVTGTRLPDDYWRLPGLSIDIAGNIYVWDGVTSAVRKLNPQGKTGYRTLVPLAMALNRYASYGHSLWIFGATYISLIITGIGCKNSVPPENSCVLIAH